MKVWRGGWFLGGLLIMQGAQASQKPHQNVVMIDLYQALAELVTDLSSDQRFLNPAHQARIEKNTKKIVLFAHNLKNSESGAADQDPTIQIVGELFADEAKRAYQSLKWGHKIYARELLRGMTHYCIACHTRTDRGARFSELSIKPTINNLRPAELGEFYAATRQFDRALTELQKVIESGETHNIRPNEWNNAVRQALAIAVRVKRSPELALKLVEQALQVKSSPFFFKQDAQAWRLSIQEWTQEPKRQPLDEEGLHTEAIRLLTKAHETQKYPADRTADIFYLRASSVVHDLLQKGPQSKYAAEAYLMAGICYDVLRPFGLGELHEIYFEACIRRASHSPLAETCYHHLQESVFEGFTGSAGTDIPEDVRQKLKLLEALATPLPITNTEKP
ncbi:hypothetical protein WDW37_04235 [Bdellovibrionota bacterium FG-1]